jgi:iron complex transport system substrate-binding protein
MSARRRVGWLSLAAVLLGVGVWRGFAPSSSTHAPVSASTTPVRIASLTLGTDEILSELVPPERMACVTFLVDDPQISNVPGIYPHQIPRLRASDPERIIGLNPDLVCVAPYNSADFSKVMERSGFLVYRSEACHSMDEIEAGILDLGKCVSEPGRAGDLVKRMRARRQQLVERLQGVPHRPRVLYWAGGFTAGRQTTINDIIREAGGINVAVEKDREGSAEISTEQVIAADPEYILLSRWSEDESAGHIDKHPLLRNLRAVTEKRVITMEGRYLTSVSQYVVEGSERLAGQLHPDRFIKHGPSDSSPASARFP